MKYPFSNAAVRRADHWEVVKELGGQGGGMTAGIAIVRDIRNGTKFIEKRVKPEDVRHGLLAKEVTFLQQLRGCFLITKITDFYSDHINLRGGIISKFHSTIIREILVLTVISRGVVEFCELGSLADLVERHAKARRPISELHVWPFFIQTADALAYCHYGPELRDQRSRDAWDSIIHRGK
jgi:serine/threonine protein kinase